jgi:cytochrome c oxidase subunit 2
MDAVPGIVTTMWFTPSVSTAEMKRITQNPNFVYEISCDQMCGKGHYSMRGTVIVHETQEEFNQWMKAQTPDYVANFASKSAPAAAKDTTKAAPAADTTKKITMK